MRAVLQEIWNTQWGFKSLKEWKRGKNDTEEKNRYWCPKLRSRKGKPKALTSVILPPCCVGVNELVKSDDEERLSVRGAVYFNM